MARPKREVAETSQVEGLITETAKEEPTSLKTVKVKEEKIEPNPLKKGDSFLFIVDGQEQYLTRTVANVLFQRNSAKVVIPKGSDYIPPQGSKCDGC